jgi:DNA replication protein DnaC
VELKPQLSNQLRGLRMSGVLETLAVRERQAIDGQWSYMEFLERLLEDEIERRAQKQLTQRLRRGALNTTKTIEGFDFQFNPGLNRQQILQLAVCEYIHQHRNLLICGPTGVGKTHLAQALGQEAARQGLDVLFISAQKMLQHIHGGRADGSLERRINTYLRPDLLILDDFGLKPIQPPGPEDLYDIINERYEKGSILLTSNRAPAEWADVFLDPLLASAGLDRLLDRAEVIILRGASYRAQTRARLTEEVPAAQPLP